ncbi:MAG TPA: class II glutamine amidotransferase [Streptosporangiaceae bacterium]|nr:class II glutamine amidotransferase [Streptosporangiaceae bacterium]
MCRLLGLNAGREPVSASFWLVDAPDSLEVQSHRNVDGSGIGFFGPAGAPVLDKQPEPAFADAEFLREARQARSPTFVAHVRYATAGRRTLANTHPFTMRGRIMAHNGGFGGLDRLEEQLGPYRDLVGGDTDSERYFALITQQIDAQGGDVAAGIAAAARWIAERLPVSSLNAIVVVAGELWALRYPGQHALHIIERPAGASSPPSQGSPAARAGTPAAAGMHVRSATSSVHAPELHTLPSVVVASEELDGEHGWRMLASGELVHVRPDMTVESAVVLPEPPAHLVPLPESNPNIDT